MTCDFCRPRVDDAAFGLLDDREQRLFDEHLATCAACQAIADEAERFRTLAKVASSSEHPVPEFTPPAEVARPVRRSRRATYALALGLALALVPLIRGGLAHDNARQRSRELAALQGELAGLADQARAFDRETADLVARQRQSAEALDRLTRGLVDAELARPAGSLRVEGPRSPSAGAPNEFRLKSADTPLEALVADAQGAVAYRQPVPADGVVRLPPSLGLDGAADRQLRLVDASGQAVYTRDLSPPVYSTHVAIDKTVYRPGETVLARSLTLERRALTPPTEDHAVWFDISGPRGVVEGSGRRVGSQPTDAGGKPILGPDGLPVRGVATAAIPLPTDLTEGDYQMRVFAAAEGASGPDPTLPPTVTTFLVARTARPAFPYNLKFAGASFAPGEPVAGTLTLPPGATARFHAEAIVGGTRQVLVGTQMFDVSAAGVAEFTLALPPGEVTAAEVSFILSHNGKQEIVVRAVPITSKTVWVELFPEGGTLVAGVQNRLYLRATGADGKPADVAGSIVDGNDAVAEFDTRGPGRRGLGVTAFTPRVGARYQLKLADPALRLAKVAFPVVAGRGIVLHATEGVVAPGRPLALELTSTELNDRNLVVGVYRRGLKVAETRLTVRPDTPERLVIPLPAESPAGVLRVTVFDATADPTDWKPVAERLVFQQPSRTLKLAAAATVSPEKSVTIDCATTTESGAAVGAVLAVAVTDRAALSGYESPTAVSLPTYFLLAPECDRPDALEHQDVLLGDSPEAARALDLVLATQGWRRFLEQSLKSALGRREPDALLAAVGALPTATTTDTLTHAAPNARALSQAEAEAADALRSPDRRARWQSQQDQATACLKAMQVAAREWDGDRFRVTAFLGIAVGLFGTLAVVAFFSRAGRWTTRATLTGLSLAAIAATLTLPTVPPTWDAGQLDRREPPSPTPVRPASPDELAALVAEDDAPPEPRALATRPMATLAPRPKTPDTIHRLPAPLTSAPRQVATAPLPPELLPVLTRLSAETDPARREVARRIARQIAAPPGHPVREYAYRRSDQATPETLLWQPCLVSHGQAQATFDLPPNAGGQSYRVTVWGHTIDGRLGAATFTLDAK